MEKNLLVPDILKKGDKVGVICTSGCVKDEKTLIDGVKYLENLGFQVIIGESCRSKYGYLAGSDEIRANDVNKMFADKEIKGVFCARGGYGVHRILDKVDFNIIKENPKYFSGYSDITGLHLAINKLCGFVTYHSPMITTEMYKAQNEAMTSYYEDFMFNGVTKKQIQNIPKEKKLICLNEGVAEGVLLGGNLCLISDLIGTPYEIDTKGKIIFIEEVEETPYAIDRMLMQLKLAGKFDDCEGIVFGAFTDCKSDEGKPTLSIEQVLEDILKDIVKPIVYGLECGHCLPTISLPMGVKARLDATNGVLEIL